jgi:uncharacterized protein (TIGR02996 family)
VLAIHYCRQDERTRRHTTERTEIAIGRDLSNDLVLADPTVADHHCQIMDHSDGWILEDLGSGCATIVNGARIRQPTVVRQGDRIYVGAFVLELEVLDSRIGPVEAGLLEGIARGDDSYRTVYADWLEERGETARAEFVRLQQEIIEAPMDTAVEKVAFVARSRRLRDLAASLDLEWRFQVARPVVEGCRVAFEIPCKMDWGTLEPTDQRDVRMCNTCRKAVHYCLDEDEAFDHADQGHCVVVDVRQLTIRCARCDRRSPRASRECLGCGAALVLQRPAPLEPAMSYVRGMMLAPPSGRRRR